MKKIVTLAVSAFALVAIAALAGCSSSSASAGFAFNSGTFEAQSKTATITLEGNPTTGYEWTAAQDGDALKQTASDYKSNGTGTQTGAGGTYTFTYEGTKAGTTTLTFTYARNWETTAADKTVTFTIVTNNSGKITQAKCTSSDGSGGEIKA